MFELQEIIEKYPYNKKNSPMEVMHWCTDHNIDRMDKNAISDSPNNLETIRSIKEGHNSTKY